MDLNRRGFLKSLAALVPALYAAPLLERIALPSEEPQLPTWVGGGFYQPGRHVVANLTGPATISEWGTRFGPIPPDKNIKDFKAIEYSLRFDSPNGTLLVYSKLHPSGLFRWVAAYGFEVCPQPGRKLLLCADLEEPGWAGGYLFDQNIANLNYTRGQTAGKR